MKQLLIALAAGMLATQAFAADVSVTDDDVLPPEVEVEAINWEGFYIGAGVGYNSLTTDVDELESDGLTLGGFGGFNAQIDSNWVVGLEGSFHVPQHNWSYGTSYEEELTVGGVALEFTFDASVDIGMDYEVTVTPRIGYLIQPNTMLYAKAGAAYGVFDTSISGSASVTSGNDTAEASASASDTQAEWGYAVGAGVEHMVTDRVFIGLDYTYTAYSVDGSIDSVNWSASDSNGNSASGSFDVSGASYDSDVDNHTFMARIGMRF